MIRLKTIVVEDEVYPRLMLLQKLKDLEDRLEIADSCGSYEAAKSSILKHRPDLLFMDIQLQGRNSIQLLEEIQTKIPLPYVIFTTAYDNRRYMMAAIKLQAVDYLMKPVSKQELAIAVDKVYARLGEQVAPLPSASYGKVTLRTSKGIVQLPTSEIAYIKAAKNYSVLVGFSGEEMLLDNLSTITGQLSPYHFIRIDRSTVVNRHNIHEVNRQKQQCVFRSADDQEIKLELTKVGTEELIANL